MSLNKENSLVKHPQRIAAVSGTIVLRKQIVIRLGIGRGTERPAAEISTSPRSIREHAGFAERWLLSLFQDQRGKSRRQRSDYEDRILGVKAIRGTRVGERVRLVGSRREVCASMERFQYRERVLLQIFDTSWYPGLCYRMILLCIQAVSRLRIENFEFELVQEEGKMSRLTILGVWLLAEFRWESEGYIAYINSFKCFVFYEHFPIHHFRLLFFPSIASSTKNILIKLCTRAWLVVSSTRPTWFSRKHRRNKQAPVADWIPSTARNLFLAELFRSTDFLRPQACVPPCFSFSAGAELRRGGVEELARARSSNARGDR